MPSSRKVGKKQDVRSVGPHGSRSPYFKHWHFRSNAAAKDDVTVVVEVTGMAAARRLVVPAAVRNEIAALKRRVALLERELIRGKPERPEPNQTAFERNMVEANARAKAERDYWQGKRDAQLLADPEAMARARKGEREFNDFLKARGIKPLPSRLPKSALPKRRTSR